MFREKWESWGLELDTNSFLLFHIVYSRLTISISQQVSRKTSKVFFSLTGDKFEAKFTRITLFACYSVGVAPVRANCQFWALNLFSFSEIPIRVMKKLPPKKMRIFISVGFLCFRKKKDFLLQEINIKNGPSRGFLISNRFISKVLNVSLQTSA